MGLVDVVPRDLPRFVVQSVLRRRRLTRASCKQKQQASESEEWSIKSPRGHRDHYDSRFARLNADRSHSSMTMVLMEKPIQKAIPKN